VSWLDGAYVDPAVTALRPDYHALLLVATGLTPGPPDAASEAALAGAEGEARARLSRTPLAEVPHLRDWREAFQAFGAKPQRTRPSVEALMRRVEAGLPRIDRLTDLYNVVSVRHAVPVGGEDLASYAGPLRLVRAAGDEEFDTVAAGETVVEHPAPGEVVWRDDRGVTCRRWNWRQCVRTRITGTTTAAVFILDGLAALGVDGLRAAGDDLARRLRDANPGVDIESRLL
jgi:DNA/RNA-binding domain of Phe-tRNA-synthetase-like protein